MTGTAFGPQGPNYTTVRPPADPKASAGVDTFFKNCSAAGAKDGTFATADFFNVMIANIRYLVRQSGITLDDLDDTMVYQAVRALTGVAQILQAPQTYYVNGATGSDSNDGLTAATAFQTLQFAAQTISLYNLNGFSITINVASGVYAGPLNLPRMSGSGNVIWNGDITTPANCTIQGTNTCAVVAGNCGDSHTMRGFKVTANGTGEVNGVQAQGALTLVLYNFEFGQCGGTQVFAVNGAQVRFDGPSLRISGGAVGNQFGLGCFIYCNGSGANVNMGNLTAPAALTITQGVSYGDSFINCGSAGNVLVLFSSIINPGNVTGTKFKVNLNGIINVNGNGDNYYPGTGAGTRANGGQYA